MSLGHFMNSPGKLGENWFNSGNGQNASGATGRMQWALKETDI